MELLKENGYVNLPLRSIYDKCVDEEEMKMVRRNQCIFCGGDLKDISDGHKECIKCGELY